MAELGEIRTGREIGRDTKADRYHKYIWQACGGCGKQRWVAIRSGKPVRTLCLKCSCKVKIISEELREKYRWAGKKKLGSHWSDNSRLKVSGENSPHWKGGRYINTRGYVVVAISLDNPYYPMSFHGRIREHRLIMARSLGRCLSGWEIVHHKNGNRQDNRLENLSIELVNEHNQITRISRLEQQVKYLKEQLKKQ